MIVRVGYALTPIKSSALTKKLNMTIYLVVFEDNQLELADSGLVFKDKGEAESIAKNYTLVNQALSSNRVCMVRTMKVR